MSKQSSGDPLNTHVTVHKGGRVEVKPVPSSRHELYIRLGHLQAQVHVEMARRLVPELVDALKAYEQREAER